MPGAVIVGMQWGDEGKGRFTDYLAKEARWSSATRAGTTPATPSSSTARSSSSSWSRAASSTVGHADHRQRRGRRPRVLVDELDMLERRASTPGACGSRATPT